MALPRILRRLLRQRLHEVAGYRLRRLHNMRRRSHRLYHVLAHFSMIMTMNLASTGAMTTRQPSTRSAACEFCARTCIHLPMPQDDVCSLFVCYLHVAAVKDASVELARFVACHHHNHRSHHHSRHNHWCQGGRRCHLRPHHHLCHRHLRHA